MMPLLAVFGATGTGKTDLALRIADRLPCHLISCDAVQVYRDLRAATAKPRGAENRHPWAMISVVEADRAINLGEWVRMAEAEARWAWSSGRLPVVVGGTGLYLRGLVKGVAKAPPRDDAVRARLTSLADKHGTRFLHRVITRLDPKTAEGLMPGDRQRLIRALEVVVSGLSLRELQGEGWRGPDRFDVLRIGLRLPREVLYTRLDARVEAFFRDGLSAECRWLLERRRLPPTAHAWKAIGYRDLLDRLEGRSAGGEEEMIRRVQQSTRRYAKRQETWFRGESPTQWFDPEHEATERTVLELSRKLWRNGLREAGEKNAPGRI